MRRFARIEVMADVRTVLYRLDPYPGKDLKCLKLRRITDWHMISMNFGLPLADIRDDGNIERRTRNAHGLFDDRSASQDS